MKCRTCHLYERRSFSWIFYFFLADSEDYRRQHSAVTRTSTFLVLAAQHLSSIKDCVLPSVSSTTSIGCSPELIYKYFMRTVSKKQNKKHRNNSNWQKENKKQRKNERQKHPGIYSLSVAALCAASKHSFSFHCASPVVQHLFYWSAFTSIKVSLETVA